MNLSTAEAAVLAAIGQRSRAYVSTADVRAVNLATEDPEFRRHLNDSLLTTPDGMPLVWLGRLLGHRAVGRVYGPDLMLGLCAATAGTDQAHFFYGGAPGVAETLAARVRVGEDGRLVLNGTMKFRHLVLPQGGRGLDHGARRGGERRTRGP